MRSEIWLRLGGLLGLGMLLLIRGAPSALAHADLVSADPPPGARLDASPAEIRLTFGEPLLPGSTFVVFGEDFQEIAGISPTLDPQSPEQLSAAVPTLPPGTYTVQWTAFSADGDEVSGSYSFSIAGPSARDGLRWWEVAGVLAIVLLIPLAWWRLKGT